MGAGGRRVDTVDGAAQPSVAAAAAMAGHRRPRALHDRASQATAAAGDAHEPASAAAGSVGEGHTGGESRMLRRHRLREHVAMPAAASVMLAAADQYDRISADRPRQTHMTASALTGRGRSI